MAPVFETGMSAYSISSPNIPIMIVTVIVTKIFSNFVSSLFTAKITANNPIRVTPIIKW